MKETKMALFFVTLMGVPVLFVGAIGNVEIINKWPLYVFAVMIASFLGITFFDWYENENN